MATVVSLLVLGQKCLQFSDTPRLDVEVLLEFVLKKDKSFLYTWPEQDVSEQQQQLFTELLLRRQKGEPVALLTGHQEFWSFSLKVNAATLVPRSETELLVEMALKKVASPCAQVLDLGTGTGAIALALAKERPAWSVVAVDAIPAAVELAVENAEILGVSNILILESDWFSQIDKQKTGLFDAIVSNPPYIAVGDPHLQQRVAQFEPESALISGHDGLSDIEQIVQQSKCYLVSGGWLLLEHGFQQGQHVRELFMDYGYQAIETIKDLAGRERVTLACIH